MIKNKLFDKWRHLLHGDSYTTHPGQWVGLYVGEEEDLACVFNAQTILLYSGAITPYTGSMHYGWHLLCVP